MEIIKPGKLEDKERRHHGACRNCGCEVRFEEKEAEWRPCEFARRGIWVVACPTENCGEEITVLI